MLIAAIFLAFGCAQPPTVIYRTEDVAPKLKHFVMDADLRSIIVHHASLGNAEAYQTRTDLPFVREGEVLAKWQALLVETLNRRRIFNDAADKKIELDVTVLKMWRTRGAPFTTAKSEMVARYELTNRQTGEILLSVPIASVGESPYSESANNPYRIELATSRAVISNVTQFLDALESFLSTR